jgi:hypothetical protein
LLRHLEWYVSELDKSLLKLIYYNNTLKDINDSPVGSLFHDDIIKESFQPIVDQQK